MTVNGYTLKKVKMMETPRGISYSADIYYNSKKIGMAYNAGNGGQTDIDLSIENRNHLPVLTLDFVEKLFSYNDYEKVFKKNMKSHPEQALAFVTYVNPFDMDILLCPKDSTIDEITKHVIEIKPDREIESLEIFRTLDDFNINIDISSQGKEETPKIDSM